MKYCSKCGKELFDEAVICMGCGCPVETAQKTNSPNTSNSDSNEYSRLMAFVNDVKTIHVLGIVSLVLCMGIGIIFQIINLVKMRKYTKKGVKGYVFPEFNLTNPNDIITYENAKKKFKTATILTSIGFGISVFLIYFAIVFAIMGEI